MKNNVTFFTYADEKYYPFVLPFVFSVLKNTDASVQIMVDDHTNFYNSYGKKLANLKCSHFEDNRVFVVSEYANDGVIPNSKRYLTYPVYETKYTYITDIDMIITKDMYEKAIENNINGMTKNKTCFFNIVRPSGDKLSGMHFVDTKKYYPKITQYLKKIEDLSSINGFGDEGFLYKMVKKCFGDPAELTKDNERILPGYHLSPNRGKKYSAIKEELCKDEDWKYAFTQFSPDFLKLF